MILISSCSCLWPIQRNQVLSWEWRCSWSSADRWCTNYIWVINNFTAYYSATYIRGFMVHLPTSFMATSLALGQSYDCPRAREVAMKDQGEIWWLFHKQSFNYNSHSMEKLFCSHHNLDEEITTQFIISWNNICANVACAKCSNLISRNGTTASEFSFNCKSWMVPVLTLEVECLQVDGDGKRAVILIVDANDGPLQHTDTMQ